MDKKTNFKKISQLLKLMHLPFIPVAMHCKNPLLDMLNKEILCSSQFSVKAVL